MWTRNKIRNSKTKHSEDRQMERAINKNHIRACILYGIQEPAEKDCIKYIFYGLTVVFSKKAQKIITVYWKHEKSKKEVNDFLVQNRAKKPRKISKGEKILEQLQKKKDHKKLQGSNHGQKRAQVDCSCLEF